MLRSAEPGWSSPYRGRSVLVLGARGFIGRAVVSALQEAGASPVCVVRGAVDAEGEIAADLLEVGALEAVLDANDPAIVFNLAGYGVDPSERDEATAARTNQWLVEQLAAAIPGDAGGWRGQRIVHVGSALEYGESSGDLNEETEPQATTLYGRTKLAGTRAITRICQERAVRGLTARLFMIYGPGEHAGRLLPSLLAAARAGEGIDLTEGRQRRDFSYVGDIAEGLLRLGLCGASPGAVVNLARGRLTAVRDFAIEAARQLEMSSDQLHFGAIPTRGHEMSHDPVAIGRLKEQVGWAPSTSIEAGIARTLHEIASERGERRDAPQA